MVLKIIGNILLAPEGAKTELNLDKDSPEFLKFIKNKFQEIGMEVEEHDHKLF